MFNPLEDEPDLFIGIIEFLAGLLFFPFIFLLVQSYLRFSSFGQEFCRKYELSLHAVLDIANKATSTSFSILACLSGLYVVSSCGIFQEKPWSLTDRFYILNNYLTFGFSYFLYDVASMYLVFMSENETEVSLSWTFLMDFLKSKPLIILHHLLVPLLGFPTLMYLRGDIGDCLLGASFLIEASTPFVSARVVLVHLNMKDSQLYFINGLLMLFSFFLCRVMLFPFLYYQYSMSTGLSLLTIVRTTPLWAHLLVLLLWAPQLIWFRKMLQGSIKILMKGKRPPITNKDPSEDNMTSRLVEEGSSEEEPVELSGKNISVEAKEKQN